VFDRVFSGVLGDDATTLVGNSGTQQIRVFDGDGRSVAVAGRQGGGPGEFRSINGMSRFRGDSILVFDLRSQRFSVLTPRGAFVRSFQNSASGGPAFPFGVFPDGSILVGVEKSYDPRIQTGRVRDTLALYRLAPDSAAIPGDTLAIRGERARRGSRRPDHPRLVGLSAPARHGHLRAGRRDHLLAAEQPAAGSGGGG